MLDYLPLPKKNERIKGEKYMYKNEIVIWSGASLHCKHDRRKRHCKECGGSQICEHGRQKSHCKECGGSAICEHGSQKFQCKKCCGSAFCEHGRRKSRCKECGGSGICEHGRQKSICKECGGSAICEHGREKSKCKECDPNGYLVNLMRSRVRDALKSFSTRKDRKHTIEYVGCSIEDLRTHLENQFEKEAERCGHPISWENQGEWHIDHIKPCASFNLDLEEERHKCFHYTNLQPMWGPDNMSKHDTYDEDEDERDWDGDKWI